jgi:hypothetical protein
MPTLARVRIALTGWDGAPGVITEHYSPGTLGTFNLVSIQDLVDEVHDRYLAQADVFLNTMYLTVDPAVELFDVATGEMTDVIVAEDAPGTVGGAGSGTSLSRATMMGIRLGTSDFRYGRRIQGRLFWGPIAGAVMHTDGHIGASQAASAAASFAASISGLGPRLCVYSRPQPLKSREGNWADVTSVTVSPVPFVLRSRRD